jgi:predicted RND superfamily exporter protein
LKDKKTANSEVIIVRYGDQIEVINSTRKLKKRRKIINTASEVEDIDEVVSICRSWRERESHHYRQGRIITQNIQRSVNLKDILF